MSRKMSILLRHGVMSGPNGRQTSPGPHLPQEIIDRTAAKYAEALRRLAG